ncbi:MAG: LPS export ABC transporter permease LptF [Desulfobulbaceae bacterium]|nr:LPS export ABC transporter permease LptF [Desulfobulbaceae bacterium]
MKLHSKAPQLLYSYLATEMLAPFFASFLIMNCVFFLAKLIPFLNFALELEINFPDFIRLFSYLFPNIFLYSIPMAAMMGVTIGFARLSSDSEILAFKASGISIYQILPPVIIVATLIALLTSFVSIKLIPLSAVSIKQLSYQLLKEKIGKGIKEHSFTEALGDVVVYVDKIDKVSGEWTDVWVSDMRGVDNPIVTMASTGKMTSSLQNMMVSIVLRNGSLHKPGNDNAQIVQFDQYQINIPLKLPESRKSRLKSTDLPMAELLEEAQHTNGNIELQRNLLIEFHKRLVLPVGCLMISLIGLPLGLQARPGKKAIGIQAGLAIFILYYILFTFGKALAEKGVMPIWLAMWTPNTLFFALAIFWTMRVANEQALVPTLISTYFGKIVVIFSEPLKAGYLTILLKLQAVSKDNRANETVETLANVQTTIRANSHSMEFHLPSCENYSCADCTLEFKNIDVALKAGFEPCEVCKEHLEKNIDQKPN